MHGTYGIGLQRKQQVQPDGYEGRYIHYRTRGRKQAGGRGVAKEREGIKGPGA